MIVISEVHRNGEKAYVLAGGFKREFFLRLIEREEMENIFDLKGQALTSVRIPIDFDATFFGSSHRFAELPSLLKPKVRRATAVNETRLKVNGQSLFV